VGITGRHFYEELGSSEALLRAVYDRTLRRAFDAVVTDVAAPAHVLLNLAIGGGWAGRYGIDDTKFPTSFDIDHVRICSGS
jgi:hypothetical protein